MSWYANRETFNIVVGGVKMKEIKIRVLHTGSVCVAPALPFGGESVNPLKLSPIMVKKSDRL